MTSHKTKRTPPRIAETLLEKMADKTTFYTAMGDYEEDFNQILYEKGYVRAVLWYWFQILLVFPSFVVNSFRGNVIMFGNYFKTTLRNMKRNYTHFTINIVGLAIGIASCLLIVFFIQDELSYDLFHSKHQRIFRAIELVHSEAGASEESASVPIPLGKQITIDYGHLVDDVVRIFNFRVPGYSIKYGEKLFNESKLFLADPSIFNVFDFTLLKGNPETALSAPFSVVITSNMAEKYFGAEDPMGKVLRYEGEHNLTVTGVVENTPANSHFSFDFLVSFDSIYNLLSENFYDSWLWNPSWTYILLKEGTDSQMLEQQFPRIIAQYFPNSLKEIAEIKLQPLADIHLRSHYSQEIEPNSNIIYLYVFGMIALLILVAACINFINLSTVQSARRAKEVGMRKVMGAFRKQVVNQYLGESIALSLFAMILAVILVEIVLPEFNNFTGKNISFGTFDPILLLAGLLVLAAVVGVLAGLYPALFSASFQPVKVLSGTFTNNAKRNVFRQVLVITQFSISIILIASTLMISDQLSFMQSKDLGFQKDGVILVPMVRTPVAQNFEPFKRELLRDQSILTVTAVGNPFGVGYHTGAFNVEGKNIYLNRLFVDYDITQAFGLELLAGEPLTERLGNKRGVLLNESAAKNFGWTPEEAVGKAVRGSGSRAVLVHGVVKDFHFASLHEKIAPLAMELAGNSAIFTSYMRYSAVRFDLNRTKDALKYVETVWNQYAPENAFDYFFVNDRIANAYQAEERLGKIGNVFSSLAIFIGCLGLFALASFVTGQRTKEIGIRKVLGASSFNINILLSKEFAMVVVLANLIAWPAAYIIMQNWLENFAYRIAIDYSVFLISGVLTLVIALATVGFRSLKTALSNPVDSLRSE